MREATLAAISAALIRREETLRRLEKDIANVNTELDSLRSQHAHALKIRDELKTDLDEATRIMGATGAIGCHETEAKMAC